MYAAHEDFVAEPYLSGGCRSLARCTATLRHRDHLHVSLLRAGGLGRASRYAGRQPAHP